MRSLDLCVVSSSSVMLRRGVYEECGLYDESMRVCEDYDLWLRVTQRHKVGLVPCLLVEKYGGHSDQLSHSESALDRYRIYALLKLLRQGDLSEIQLEKIHSAIIRKCKVLAVGAKKRGKLTRASLFEEIPNALVASWDLVIIERLILAIKNELISPEGVDESL